jgi:hypothetical protein
MTKDFAMKKIATLLLIIGFVGLAGCHEYSTYEFGYRWGGHDHYDHGHHQYHGHHHHHHCD